MAAFNGPVLMGRSGDYMPSADKADTFKKLFTSDDIVVNLTDPSTVSGVVLHDNDLWWKPTIDSQTPTPTPVGDPGTYKPDSTTAGLPAGWVAKHTLNSGQITLSASGKTNDPNNYITGSGTATDPWYLYKLDIQNNVHAGGCYFVIDQCNIHVNIFGTGGSEGVVVNDPSTGLVSSTALFKSTYGWNTTLPSGNQLDYACVIKDTELFCDVASYQWDGIYGKGWLGLRVEIHHTTDGVGMLISSGTLCNTALVASYVHDNTYGANDPYHTTVQGSGTNIHGDGSHSDGCQGQGGLNQWLIGNSMAGFLDISQQNGVFWLFANQNNSPPAAGMNYYDDARRGYVTANIGFQFNQNTAASSGGVWMNWFDGYHFGINLSTTGTSTYGNFDNGIYIIDNKFTRRNGAPGNAAASGTPPTTVTWYSIVFNTSAIKANVTYSGNVYDEAGFPPSPTDR